MAWRRRARSGAIWTLAGTVIALAVLVGLIQLALPWWASDPQRVARLLSSRLGSPVRIEATVPSWSPRGPLIELRGVQFGAAGDAGARIERAAWAIDFAGLVRPGRVFSEFRVHGLDLSLVRSGDGRWEVLGLPELLRGPERPLASVLQALPAFALRDSRLTVGYAPGRPAVQLRLPELRRVGGGSGSRWRGWLFPGATAGGRGLGLSLDMAADGSGRVHIAGAGLVLADWLGAVEPLGLKPVSGELTVSAWIDLDRRGVNDVQLELELGASTWAPPPAPAQPEDPAGALAPTALPAVRFGARVRRQGEGDGRAILVDQLAFGGGPPGRLAGQLVDGDLRLRGQALELAPLAAAAALVDAVPAAARRWLAQARPGGRVDALALELVDGALRQATVDLSGLQAAPVPGSPGQPGVSGLAIRLRGDGDGLVLTPAATPFAIDYPGVFAQPLPMRADAGAIAAWRQDDAWQLAAEGLQLSGAGYAIRLDGGALLRPDAPPLLDLGALVLDSQVEAAKAFWPLNRIPNTARWLNRALKGGRIVEARAWLRGPANGFPFQDGSGRLDAQVRIADGGLDYHPDWPELSAIQADLTFENARMAVASDSLQVAGLTVTGSSAEVADLKQPIVTVAARARVPGDRLLALVSATPLQVRYGRYLEDMAIEGAPRVDLALQLPLKRELGESTVDGRVRFAGERFTDSGWELDFGDLDGELSFTRNAITVQDLSVSLAGEPARLDLRIGAASSDPQAAVQAELRGRLSAAAVFGRVPALASMLSAASGRADWRVRVQVPDGADGSAPAAPGWIRIDSDLKGIALDLPAPLAKEAEAALPLRLDAATQVRTRPIELRLGRLLAMRAQLADAGRPFAGTVALGGASPEQLPDRGLVISGQVPALDLSGWLGLVAGPGAGVGGEGDAGIDWPRVILRAGELGVFGRGFREVDLQMRPGPDTVDVQLLGPDIQGSIQWPRAAAGRVVRGRFVRLHVPAGASSSVAGNLQPGAMPALDIEVEDTRIGGTQFGRTVLQAQVADDGYRIGRFESRNSAFDLDASGQWRMEDGADVSEMAIRLRADDLGTMLESFGFAGLIQGGRTEVGIDGRWAGSPAAFALERIDGRLDVKVGAGRIVDVDPGVGRLFGLLNLREIPRRLVLDFRDIFSQGMRFNSIEGSFQLNVGDAYTDNVMLKSPAADILITGRTGLIMRDYDQTLEVTPRLGGALPVVGAIAAGPAGAAAGLVVQGLLRIDQSNRILYRVSGPWDRPEIDKQEPVPAPDRRQRGQPDPGQAGP